jgi:hypothetical protein
VSEYSWPICKQSWHRKVLESIQLRLNHPLYLTILSLRLYLSLVYQILSLLHSLHIVVKVILQTVPRWKHEREVILTILHYQPLTYLQDLKANRTSWKFECPSGGYATYWYSNLSLIYKKLSMNPCNSAVTLKVPNLSSSADSKCCTNSMPCGHLKYSNIHT